MAYYISLKPHAENTIRPAISDTAAKYEQEPLDNHHLLKRMTNEKLMFILNNGVDPDTSRTYTRDEVLDAFIEKNTRFIYSCINRVKNKMGGLPASFSSEDLYMEAVGIVIDMVSHWDETQGTLVTTYLFNQLEGRIKNAINENRSMIRIPRTKRSEAEKQFINYNVNHMESLNAPVEGKDGDTVELGDMVESDAFDPNKLAMSSAQSRELVKMIRETITDDREFEILMMCFGLKPDGSGRTRALSTTEVGNVFNMTRQSVYKIEQKALKKLRKPGFLEALNINEITLSVFAA